MYLGICLLKKCFKFQIDAKIQIFSRIILANDYKCPYLCNDYKRNLLKIRININFKNIQLCQSTQEHRQKRI